MPVYWYILFLSFSFAVLPGTSVINISETVANLLNNQSILNTIFSYSLCPLKIANILYLFIRIPLKTRYL